MKAFANILTQVETDECPSVVGATLNPTWEQLKEAGYRRLTLEDTVPEGFRAAAWRYDDVDGETCRKTLVSSVNVADEAAAAEAAAAAAEIARQLAKPMALKGAENVFLGLCDQLEGRTTHEKLGFDELDAMVSGMSDQMAAAALGLKLLEVNAECVREGGVKWWDDCVWHPEIVA